MIVCGQIARAKAATDLWAFMCRVCLRLLKRAPLELLISYRY